MYFRSFFNNTHVHRIVILKELEKNIVITFTTRSINTAGGKCCKNNEKQKISD